MFYKINNINFYSTVQGEPLEIPETQRELGMHKCNDKFTITDIKTGAEIVEGDSRDKAIKKLLKVKDEINSISSEHEEHLINYLNKLVDYQTYEKYKEIFSDTFGHDILTFCNLIVLNISHRVKLDVARFDDFFKYELKYDKISL